VTVRHLRAWCLAAVLCGIGLEAAAPALRAQAAVCDRTCLTGIMDAYLAALVAHAPDKAPLARTVRFTENTGVLDVGEGLWIGASEAPSTFRLYVPDPATDQVAFIGMMKEFDRPILVAVRLRVLNRRVIEAEHVVVRDLSEPVLKNLVSPRAAFTADVPAEQRVPRPEMVRVADSYYDALSTGISTFTPFAADCVRHENGLQTSTNRSPVPPPAMPPDQVAGFSILAGLGCAAQVDSQMFAYITSIDLRRVQIVDEQKGLVFGLTMFRHLGRTRTLPLKGVPGLTSIPVDVGPIDLQAAHVFKIANGAIHEIEAIGYTLPYKSRSGWER
jgi:hypothetical protein